MNPYLLAVLLGIIEGVTEFLPISSTAHLRISQALFGLDLADEYWKMFAVVIQLGAILSVIVYFRPRLVGFWKSFQVSNDRLRHPLSLVFIAFLLTAGPTFLLRKIVGHNLESLHLIGTSMVVGGLVMWWVDWKFRNPKTLSVEGVSIRQASGIGLIQILSAVFPGVSRSMATIAGGQILGLSRAAALEFSFFVSIPTMVAATGYDLLKSLRAEEGGRSILTTAEEWVTLGIGFTVSFVVALAVIAWFMGWVRNRGFVPFAIYRIVVGLLVLIFL